ncbi:MAG: hypothetical protein EHM17_00850 [Verrucomicrobiaceae bacterium]|jgi:hypothetical protein|nr:MAG: hypothetical protein EHM17_00850 [Verrucomicrobiaceae bacterium]
MNWTSACYDFSSLLSSVVCPALAWRTGGSSLRDALDSLGLAQRSHFGTHLANAPSPVEANRLQTGFDLGFDNFTILGFCGFLKQVAFPCDFQRPKAAFEFQSAH